VALNLYPDIYTSGAVPMDWVATKGVVSKYPVRNPVVHRCLRLLVAGKWQKVMKTGNTGKVHYFEHASGQVAGVKFFPELAEE